MRGKCRRIGIDVVLNAVAVRIAVFRIGALATRLTVVIWITLTFRPVGQIVPIRINVERIGEADAVFREFLAVGQPIVVRVEFLRIGADLQFDRQRQAVAVLIKQHLSRSGNVDLFLREGVDSGCGRCLAFLFDPAQSTAQQGSGYSQQKKRHHNNAARDERRHLHPADGRLRFALLWTHLDGKGKILRLASDGPRQRVDPQVDGRVLARRNDHRLGRRVDVEPTLGVVGGNGKALFAVAGVGDVQPAGPAVL